MEITWPKTFQTFERHELENIVDRYAVAAGCVAEPTSWNGKHYRFTLPGATDRQHEEVIRKLLELAPSATVKSIRARYRGLQDYRNRRAT